MKKLISPIIVYLILISAFGGLTFKANAKHTEKTEKIFYTTSQGVRIASLNILPQADLGFQDSAVCRIVFNYSLPYEELDVPNSSTKAIEVDNLIEDQREQARKFFLEKNIQIIQKYNLPSDTYINEYAPSVSFSLENDFDGYSELLENLNNDKCTSNICGGLTFRNKWGRGDLLFSMSLKRKLSFLHSYNISHTIVALSEISTSLGSISILAAFASLISIVRSNLVAE